MTTQRLFAVTAHVLLIVSLVLINDTASAATYPKEGGAFSHSWDENLPSASRFTILTAFNNEAVRDNNTGLVWEKSPATAGTTWFLGRTSCLDKNVGGQKGWRLPAIAELASLIDPSVPSPGPTLPSGHPFLNVQANGYWSATTNAQFPTTAWAFSFSSGQVFAQDKTSAPLVWCVRGGMNADQY